MHVRLAGAVLLFALFAVPTASVRAQGIAAAPPAVRPSNAEIDARLRHTVEVGIPGEHFKRILERTISDGRGGGTITAVVGMRFPTADGLGHIVFFWHNQTFAGYAAPYETPQVDGITSPGPGSFRIEFTQYRKNDAACCPSLKPRYVVYSWSSYHYFISNGVPPKWAFIPPTRVKYRP